MKKRQILFYSLISMTLFGCNETLISSNTSSKVSSFFSQESSTVSQSSSESSPVIDEKTELIYQLIEEQYVVVGRNGSNSTIEIPNEYQNIKVTKIGKDAFKNDEALTKVILSENILEIEESAFAYCTNLENISLTNVQYIGKNAFLWNHNLNEINLSDNLKYLGENAFFDTGYYNNNNNWSDKLLYIDNCLVALSSNISGEVIVKDGTILLSDYLFYSKSSVIRIMLPLSLEKIERNVFNYNTSLKYLSVKHSLDVGGYIKVNFRKSISGEFDIYERN